MRKWTRMLLLGALFTVLLCTSALAADDKAKGIELLEPNSSLPAGVTVSLQAQTANQNPVTSKTEAKDGHLVYKDAVRFSMTCAGLTEGTEYLVFVLDNGTAVPMADNIVYIDQQAGASGSITVNIYPKSFANKKTYHVFISGQGMDEPQEVASFGHYAPYTLGDANGDEKINIRDVTAIINHVKQKAYITDSDKFAAANVYEPQREVLNIRDVTKLISFIKQKITSLE